jgi:iron complex outermembrane receptor protein
MSPLRRKLFQVLVLFLICIPFLNANAQSTAVITGYITGENGQPLEHVSVVLGGKGKGTRTDSTGRFVLKVTPGKHLLQVGMVGYQTLNRVVDAAATTAPVHLQLTATTEELQNIEIVGRREKGYKNTVSFIGSKTATPLKDVPQSISYVTKELMQDQAVAKMGDVVKNFSGVNQFTFYDDITIRGFRINGGSTTQLFNGLRTFTGFWKQPMVNYLERVEVIKGPAAALYGNSSPGGTVNRVTKKPLDQARKSMSFTVGSYNNFRALADFTGPANEEKTLLYRLNLGYENTQSFRDLQFDKNIVIAPSVSFLPSANTRLNLDVVYNKSNSRLDRGQSVNASKGLYSGSISQSVAEVNDYLNEETYMVTASLNHSFTKDISFTAGYLRTGYNQDLLEHRSANAYAKDKLGNDIPNLVARQVFMRQQKQYSDNLSAYLNFHFATGIVDHKLLVGYDYAQQALPPGSAQSTANGYLKKDGTTTATYKVADSSSYVFYNYTDPSGNVMSIPKPNVSSFDLARNQHALQDMSKYVFNAVANGAVTPLFSNLNGVYLQDQLTLGRWQLLLGLRYETYADRINYKSATEQKVNQHALIPRAGLVYTLNKHINLYGIYSRGYNPQDATIQANPLSGGPFDPIESSLVEGGLKTDWLKGRLTVNASVYRIEQTNTLYPASDPGNPDKQQQIGKERAKGIELDVVGAITSNWNVVMTYAYNDAKIVSAKSSGDTAFIGNQKPNAPKQQGSVWTKYTISKGGAKGLGAGIGANFVTRRNLSLNGAQSVPGYALLNAALYYTVNKVQVQFNFNNLLNKTYWVGGYDYLRLFPGMPRNWQATISYLF